MNKNNKTDVIANRKSSALWAGLSFVVPGVAMMLVLIICAIAPFGSNTLISDVNDGWFSGFCRLYESIINGDSVLYHFNTGYGSSFYSEFASELCSPFMFVTLFFSSKNLAAAYSMITVLRAAFAGLCAWIALNKISGGSKYCSFALSCGYALCGFAACAAYYPASADSLVFFPLLALGIYNYVNESRYIHLFAFGSMFFIICSRMTVAAIVVSFVFYAAFYFRRGSKRLRVYKLAMFAAMLLCSAATAAILLVPTGASAVYYRGGIFSEVGSIPPQELLATLFFGGYGTSATPGTYYFCLAGLLIAGTAAFMLNSRIKIGERMALLVGITIVLLSAVISPLGTVLFGFCGATGEMVNIGFMLAMIAIYCTARNFAEANGINTTSVVIASAIFVLPAGLSLVLYGSDVFAIIAEIGLAAVFFALFVKVSCDRQAPSIKTSGVIAAVMVLFGMIHCNASIVGMDRKISSDAVSSDSVSRMETMQEIADSERANGHSMAFFRYRSIDNSACNGVDLNDNEIEGFSEFMHLMGVVESDKSGGGNNFTPLTDILFSVSYTISDDAPQSIDYAVSSPAYLVENAEGSSRQWANAFEYQNQIASDWFGVDKLFDQAEYTSVGETSSAESDKYKWTFGNENTTVVQYVVKLAEGETLYMLAEGGDYGFAVNDDSRSAWRDASSSGIYCVTSGDGAEETKIYLCHSDAIELSEPVFMTVSADSCKKLSNNARAKGGKYISRRGDSVKFMMSCAEEQIAVTSIPYEYGWEITVNGEKVEPFAVREGLIGISLAKGNNSIIMQYRPPFFRVGMAISIIMFAVGLYMAVYAEHEIYRRRKVRMAFRAVELNLEREKSADIGKLMQQAQSDSDQNTADKLAVDDGMNVLSDDENNPYEIAP